MDQLSNLGGSTLAANFGALSVDHLEYLDPEGIQALAHRGVVATLLPTAFYFLKETAAAGRRAAQGGGADGGLLRHQPGYGPDCVAADGHEHGLHPVRPDPGGGHGRVTRHAARALGEQEQLGQLRVGMLADFLVWNCGHPVELSYLIGVDQLVSRVVNGEETLHG